MLTDPQDLATSARVIQEHRYELEYLANLITWRVKLRGHEQREGTAGDEFCWQYALRGWGHDVPPEIEEDAVGFYDSGDHERAAPIFQLLVDCFDRYAEGHNYLGLIALARSDFAAAIARFEKTIELGRRLFPAQIGKKRYWADHDTRPFMRGLRNLTIALVEAGRFDEALKVCDRLEHECGDIESASWHRAKSRPIPRRALPVRASGIAAKRFAVSICAMVPPEPSALSCSTKRTSWSRPIWLRAASTSPSCRWSSTTTCPGRPSTTCTVSAGRAARAMKKRL